MDRYTPIYAQQRLFDQLTQNQTGMDPRLSQLIGTLGLQTNAGGHLGSTAIGQNPIHSSPYGQGWSARFNNMAEQSIMDLINSLGGGLSAEDVIGGGGGNGGGGGGGNGGGGGGGYSGSGAYGQGNNGLAGGGWAYPAPGLDPRFGYGPDESANDPSQRNPFDAQFRIPASFASQFPPGTDIERAYYEQVYAPQIAKNPMTKIPAWAWGYALDAEGRGYPPGSYGQLADGTWVTPDGLDPLGVDTGQYSMDAFGKNPPGQDTGPGSPGADYDFSKYPFPGQTPGGQIPNGKAPAVQQGGFVGSGAGGGPARRRAGGRGGNRQGIWSGPARRPKHPNGGFQANGATAFGGGGRNVPAGGGNSFPGGGYAMPGQIDREVNNRRRDEPSWSGSANRRGGSDNDVVRVSDNGRRTRYADGTVVREGKERERVRTRDNGNGTTTNVTVTRNGGTAISNQSGGDGNRGRNAGNGGSANANADRQRVVEQAQRAAKKSNDNNRKREDERSRKKR